MSAFREMTEHGYTDPVVWDEPELTEGLDVQPDSIIEVVGFAQMSPRPRVGRHEYERIAASE